MLDVHIRSDLVRQYSTQVKKKKKVKEEENYEDIEAVYSIKCRSDGLSKLSFTWNRFFQTLCKNTGII